MLALLCVCAPVAQECAAAVHAAEAHAARHRGWSTRRHARHPSHDIPIQALGELGTRVVRAHPALRAHAAR